MPSKLPIIKANTTAENIAKMKIIAESNKRSVAKELEWLIERHIESYEKENGIINLVPSVEELAHIMTDKEIPTKERLKKTFEASYNVGRFGKFDSDNQPKAE